MRERTTESKVFRLWVALVVVWVLLLPASIDATPDLDLLGLAAEFLLAGEVVSGPFYGVAADDPNIRWHGYGFTVLPPAGTRWTCARGLGGWRGATR